MMTAGTPLEPAVLLARCLAAGDESAFTGFVQQHMELVYATACRQLSGHRSLADDVAQTVFIDLARKACALPPDTVLAGWLYQHTCFIAQKALRTEIRRRRREETFVAMKTLDSSAEENRNRDVSELDDVLSRLKTAERDVIVLRFFKDEPFRQIGLALRISEDAARMRVERALQRLRTLFANRGVHTSTGALAAILSAQGSISVPAGLAIKAASAALHALTGAAAGSATGTAASISLLMTKTHAALFLALAVASAVMLWQKNTIQRLNSGLAALRENVDTGAQARDMPYSALALVDPAELDRLRRNESELLRLRGEVTLLRQPLRESAKSGTAPEIAEEPRSEPPAAPAVRTFRTEFSATVPHGHAVLSGGWKTQPGKRSFVLLSPMILSEAVPGNTPGTVLVQARWVEAGETQLTALNLSELMDREPDQPFTGTMNAEELRALIEALENTEGVEILSAPRIQTSSGVQGSISVTEQKVINGESHVLGPAIDMLPRITANGEVEMTVLAALTLEE